VQHNPHHSRQLPDVSEYLEGYIDVDQLVLMLTRQGRRGRIKEGLVNDVHLVQYCKIAVGNAEAEKLNYLIFCQKHNAPRSVIQ
jgi:hypothetical protein